MGDRDPGPDVAIVTGAARGIGAATVARLRRDGHLVVGVDLDAPSSTAGPGADAFVRGDVADPATAAAAVDAAARLGDLRALVNNAGLALDRAFTAQTDEEWRTVWRTVVDGTRTTSLAAVRAMQAAAAAELAAGPDAVPRARRVVATVPATARTATAGGSASAAAGGAVASLVTTMARELGGHGIRVNAVMVGHVATRMTRPLRGEAVATPDAPGLPEPVRQMAAATTALGRFATPEEVAAVHAFLVGPDADYVTGAVIPVTGGLLGT